MNFVLHAEAGLELGDGRVVRAAIGKGGFKPARLKREGDGATPVGIWRLKHVLYRPDRAGPPATNLPASAIEQNDGWCDAPNDPAYNRPVTLPYPASAEAMWREDGAYDLVVVLGHNDAPPVAGLGSAIFMHLAREDYSPTEGCVALSRPDLEALLRMAKPGDALEVRS